MRILTAMSGGVDSSVVCHLMKQKGHDVEGIMMIISDTKTKNIGTHTCCLGADKTKDIEAVKEITDKLNIKFNLVDLKSEFNKQVLDVFKSEYIKGRTPNPCVLCNEKIKFGTLLQYAKDFDKMATGHYVRIEKENDRYLLKKGVEDKKDQSYFLYRLNQEQLSKIITPLGNYTKDETRKMAHEFNISTFNKPDSQDFYNGDYNELLNIEDKIGNIVDTNGKILGKHNGIWNYTIGQRKGLKVSHPYPLYVLKLDSEKNEVVVGYKDETFNNYLYANNINWIVEPKCKQFEVKAKVRSVQKEKLALVTIFSHDRIKVEFDTKESSLTLGQSVVLYDDDVVLGGGIIDEVY